MPTQVRSKHCTQRTLYLCLALVIILTCLAIIPLPLASGKVNSSRSTPPVSELPLNVSKSQPARPVQDNDREAASAISSLLRLIHPLALSSTTRAPNFSTAYSAVNYSPPTISLTVPTSNATFIAGSTIALGATATDSDGTVAKVEFFQGSVKLGEDTTAPYTYNWSNVAAGSYVLTALATDNAGEVKSSAAINISVLPQAKQSVSWSSLTNGTDLGNGSLRKTSAGAWDFYASSLQTLLPGDGYFESTAASYNQSLTLVGNDGSTRALIIGSGGWVGIYENGQEVANTSPLLNITPHAAGDRYRIEITNSILRYIRYRSSSRETMFTSAGALPAYPIVAALQASPQNAEWQKTTLAQLTRKAAWAVIANGMDLGNGSVRKTSTGSWDFSATAMQALLRGDGYFESTASMYNQSISLAGSDGAGSVLVIGSGGWVGIYENGVEVAATCCHPPSEIIPVHVAGDRYRMEISGGKLKYVKYRSGVRTIMFTSAAPLPPYPLGFSLGASPQNAEWQNTVIAQLSQTVSWAYVTNGIDLGNGSVRKTSTGAWDFAAGLRQQLVYGNGYFESTAASYIEAINLGGADGASRSLIAGTGGWADISENGQEVAATCCSSQIIPVHVAGDRYRLEVVGGKLRYVRYRAGVRTTVFTSGNTLPSYPLGYYVSASPQNTEWQNTVFSDNLPEQNDASFVSQTVPTTMVPGQNYAVAVTMRNTGASTWTLTVIINSQRKISRTIKDGASVALI
jgi:hypothetical protein